MLAQSEDGLLRAQRTFEFVVLPVADRTEEHRVGRLRQLERGIRQRMAMRVVRRTADVGELELEALAERAQDLDRLGDDFLADAVTREHCDLHSNPLSQSTMMRSQNLNTR